MNLASFPKLLTPQEKYRQEYKRVCEEKYKNWIKLRTDGSKREEGVGAAVVWNSGIRSATLPNEKFPFICGVVCNHNDGEGDRGTARSAICCSSDASCI